MTELDKTKETENRLNTKDILEVYKNTIKANKDSMRNHLDQLEMFFMEGAIISWKRVGQNTIEKKNHSREVMRIVMLAPLAPLAEEMRGEE